MIITKQSGCVRVSVSGKHMKVNLNRRQEEADLNHRQKAGMKLRRKDRDRKDDRSMNRMSRSHQRVEWS